MELWWLAGLIGFLLVVLLRVITRAHGYIRISSLQGYRVLITGASSGIGLELAKLAAKEGAHVTLLARNPARLAEAKISVASNAPNSSSASSIRTLSADVRDFESLNSALAECPPIDILILCHGISFPATLENSTLDELNQMVDINLKGSLYTIKAALPLMKGRQNGRPGRIALYSSQAGQVGLYGYTTYGASKFALRGLAESLQQEVLVDNIRVSIIYPPDTETPGLIAENEQKPELTKILSASSCLMKAFDVAKISLDGIKAGHYSIPCNFDGRLLAWATAGMAPQPSLREAFAEVMLSGITRIIALCILWDWNRKVVTWHTQHSKKK